MINVSIHPKELKEKPDRKMASLISSSIHEYKSTISKEEFIEEIGKGKSWTSCFSDKRSRKNWIHQQIFASDLDSGEFKSINQILEICGKYIVEPFCIHPTFSYSDNHPKWRVIFSSNVSIPNPQLALNIQRFLADIFNGDPSVCDISRLYYGGVMSEIWYKNLKAKDLEVGDYLIQGKIGVKRGIKEPLEDGNILKSPRAKLYKQIIREQKNKILNLEKGSGYESVWHSAYKLGGIKELTTKTIYANIKKWVDSSPVYANWQHYGDLEKIVKSGVEYGRKYPF